MPHETGITPLERCERGGLGNKNGMWRSLVAHLTGGQGVAGSNPVIPTIFPRKKANLMVGLLFFFHLTAYGYELAASAVSMWRAGIKLLFQDAIYPPAVSP